MTRALDTIGAQPLAQTSGTQANHWHRSTTTGAANIRLGYSTSTEHNHWCRKHWTRLLDINGEQAQDPQTSDRVTRVLETLGAQPLAQTSATHANNWRRSTATGAANIRLRYSTSTEQAQDPQTSGRVTRVLDTIGAQPLVLQTSDSATRL